MIYDQLPVYKTVYDLLILVYQWSRNLSKDYRYTLGESLKKDLMNLLISIYQANATTNKGAVLTKAREQHVAIKLQIRLLDVFFLIHRSKEYLKKVVGILKEFLSVKLGLTIHPRKIVLQHYKKGAGGCAKHDNATRLEGCFKLAFGFTATL